METHAVVPDSLDTAPPALATVIYGPEVEMQNGAELTPLQAKDTPTEVTWPAETNALYTLIFTDLDPPSREQPLYREILHWLVINVPGNKLENGQTIADYVGPGAPEGTGLHRYVLTVYKQSNRLAKESLVHLESRAGRMEFSTRDFVAKFRLGAPIAGNFFRAQADDYTREKRYSQLKATLLPEKIVPEIIDDVPRQAVLVGYGSGGFVNFGSELTPTAVKDQPLAVLWPSVPDALYTLIMIDPDAPSRAAPQYRECLHWLVINIPDNDIASGDTYAAYGGAGPPSGTGLHRYIFLIYKQPAGRIADLGRPRAGNRSMEGRIAFNTREFAKQHHLVGPVAANFFQAQYDDYCAELAAEIAAANKQ